ncbi:hypothetical protein Rhe02_67670 [Rhizocola hellebori]|uniref:Uncharacterized protein n=1 Tax=Rhizocola hellebori TaxID=1392758 RepID=A0A8J3QDE9_9ACTN|nr:hypothetical protein [Rhizocola hellebori]GIH08700.1 hypothetical protein Rhe02_67670 [Rhizocola hellebori]
MTEIKVYLDAMTKYADAMDKLGEDFGATKQRLYDADVTEDSFGMLSESREAAKIYEQRTTDGLDVLKAGEETCAGLADAFRQLRTNYEGTDQDLATRIGGN